MTIPTGMRVLLKIGPGLTNTGAATLNMDAIGPVAIKDQFANELIGGELLTNSYADLLYDGTNWILLNRASGSGSGGSGKLMFVSATTLSFLPYGGNSIKINSSVYDIPAAGVVGTTNTNVYVNGVAAQNLAADTLYYVYAFMNGSVVTADFSTTSHATSTATGNVGVEIKAGPDETRTLLGMIRTNASSQFADDVANRFVVSWFHRTRKSLFVRSGTSTSTTAIAELEPGARVKFISWGEEAVDMLGSAYMNNNTTDMQCFFSVGLDSTTTPEGGTWIFPGGGNSAGTNFGFAIGGSTIVTEGYHYFTAVSRLQGGAGTYVWQLSGSVIG